MRRVLFVDDEPMVLRSLESLMRPWRKRWEMVFVGGGEAALVELGKAPFDVVVSDMRMPRIDGAELLHQVAAAWPATRRLILTGYADSDSLERAAKVAHVCLEKPCDADALYDAIKAPGDELPLDR